MWERKGRLKKKITLGELHGGEKTEICPIIDKKKWREKMIKKKGDIWRSRGKKESSELEVREKEVRENEDCIEAKGGM